MAGDFLALVIDGPDGRVVAAQIEQNRGRLADEYLPDVLQAAGRYLREVVMDRQVEAEGAELGDRWAGLDARYLAWKLRHGYPAEIGQRTTMLRRALTGEPGFERAESSDHGSTVWGRAILEIEGDVLTIGAETREVMADTGEASDYAPEFDAGRPVFGRQELPPSAEQELGKLLALAYMAACHTDAGGVPDHAHLPDEVVTRYLASLALLEIVE